MANQFAVQPTLPSPFPAAPAVWTCPETGLKVPKDPVKNLEWRARLLEAAQSDRGLRAELYTASSKSVLFWINAFAFTLRIKESDEAGKQIQARNAHIPFVTWEIQDRHALAIEHAIDNGYDLLTDKTRDMGASWMHIAVFHHQWLFREGRLFLEMSRVETDVDGADNPRCLFVKHDYINKWLPEWMRPEGVLPGGKHRTRMHLVNPLNGSRIDGESSNKAAGSGDRRHAILMDEFAKMENAEKIKAATRDVGPRLVNSTPWGAGTTYSKWRLSGQIKVFSLPWYEHPEKGRGRYCEQDADTGKWMIRSPWYNAEAEVRTPREMAQEIDMDHIGSGDVIFDPATLELHKRLYCKPPRFTRKIDFRPGVTNDKIAEILLRRDVSKLTPGGGIGPLRIWCNLINKRPDQSLTYVVACDISKGQGASNSVATVLCRETGEKIAEWADANTPPHEFARIACAISLWAGGASQRGLALLGWEANGPGWGFGREVVKTYRHPVFWVDRRVGAATEKKTDRYGWTSSRDKKDMVLTTYHRALSHGGFVNPSTEAIDEAGMYVQYETGGCGPATLMQESEDARKVHGDRVIADALALWMLDDTPPSRTGQVRHPERSFAACKRAWDKRRKQREGGTTFDFRS